MRKKQPAAAIGGIRYSAPISNIRLSHYTFKQKDEYNLKNTSTKHHRTGEAKNESTVKSMSFWAQFYSVPQNKITLVPTDQAEHI